MKKAFLSLVVFAAFAATSASAATFLTCTPVNQNQAYLQQYGIYINGFELRIGQPGPRSGAQMRVHGSSRSARMQPRLVNMPNVRFGRAIDGEVISGNSMNGDDWFEVKLVQRGIMGGRIMGTITIGQDFGYDVTCQPTRQ